MRMRYNGNSPVCLTWEDRFQVVAVGEEIEVAEDDVPQYAALGFVPVAMDAPARKKRPAQEETHADEPSA